MVSKYRQLFPELWLSTGGERECGEVVEGGRGLKWKEEIVLNAFLI